MGGPLDGVKLIHGPVDGVKLTDGPLDGEKLIGGPFDGVKLIDGSLDGLLAEVDPDNPVDGAGPVRGEALSRLPSRLAGVRSRSR